MPIYEYTCKKCDTAFEELVYGSDAGVRCPRCKSARVKKALSVFGMGRGGKNGGAESAGSHSGTGHSCSGCSGNCGGCK